MFSNNNSHKRQGSSNLLLDIPSLEESNIEEVGQKAQTMLESLRAESLLSPIERLKQVFEKEKEDLTQAGTLEDVMNASQDLVNELQDKRATLSPEAATFILGEMSDETRSPDFRKNFNIVGKVKKLFVNKGKEVVMSELGESELGEDTEQLETIIDFIPEKTNKKAALKLVRKGAVKAGKGIVNAVTSQATQDVVMGVAKGAVQGIPFFGPIIGNTGEAVINNISRNVREQANRRMERIEQLKDSKRQSLLLIENETDKVVIEEQQTKISEIGQEIENEEEEMVKDLTRMLVEISSSLDNHLNLTKELETIQKDLGIVNSELIGATQAINQKLVDQDIKSETSLATWRGNFGLLKSSVDMVRTENSTLTKNQIAIGSKLDKNIAVLSKLEADINTIKSKLEAFKNLETNHQALLTEIQSVKSELNKKPVEPQESPKGLNIWLAIELLITLGCFISSSLTAYLFWKKDNNK